MPPDLRARGPGEPVNLAVPRCGAVVHTRCPQVWRVWKRCGQRCARRCDGGAKGPSVKSETGRRWAGGKLSPQAVRSHRRRSGRGRGGDGGVVPSVVPRGSTRHAAESTCCPHVLWETRLLRLPAARSVPWYPQREGGYWPQVTTDRRASAQSVARGPSRVRQQGEVRRHGRGVQEESGPGRPAEGRRRAGCGKGVSGS